MAKVPTKPSAKPTTRKRAKPAKDAPAKLTLKQSPKETIEQERLSIMDEICEEIANTDKSLWDICSVHPNLPCSRTIARWIADDETLCQKYSRAKELQADFMAAQIRSIADECRIGVKTTDRGEGKVETVTGDMVERSRLQIDARKWLASKLAPKKYGDKMELSGDSDSPLTIRVVNFSNTK
jgi:hypothetical protein